MGRSQGNVARRGRREEWEEKCDKILCQVKTFKTQKKEDPF